jgi:hypothetical protein
MKILRGIFLSMYLALAVGANSAILPNIFPENIKLGISYEELKFIRPEANKSPVTLITRPKELSDKAFELVERLPSEPGSYIYVFRSDSLQAIVWSEPVHPALPPSVNPKLIHRELERNLIKLGSKNVARANSTLEFAAIEAELWDYRGDNTQIYFVSTSEETTIIKFNPLEIREEIFFKSADKIPELQAEANRILTQTDSIRKTAPALVDRPWKDLPENTTSRPRRSVLDVLTSPSETHSNKSKEKGEDAQRRQTNFQSPTFFVVVLVLAVIGAGLIFTWGQKKK